MLTLHITVKGLEDKLDELDKASERLDNLEPIWEAFARHELIQAQNRIRQGGPGWPSTHFPANLHPELQFSGTLLESLDPNSNDTIDADNEEVSFGTDVPYAVFQQEGTKGRGNALRRKTKGLKASGGIDARKFLYINSDDQAWLETAIKNYIQTGQVPSQ